MGERLEFKSLGAGFTHTHTHIYIFKLFANMHENLPICEVD